MAEMRVLRCSCTHEYQDAKYGRGMRMCNPMQSGRGAIDGYRCSVCGKELSGGERKASAKQPADA